MKSDLESMTRAHLDVCAQEWGEWDTLDFVLEYALMMLERIVKIEREIAEEHNIATSTTLDYEHMAKTIKFFRQDVLGEKGGQL
jgi:hypothetical protein